MLRAVLLMLGLMGPVETFAANRPPNVVLIVSDDQGYNDLGVLNPELISPHLDRLATEGVRLTNFYVAWPACTPSRGALLTGRYPQRNGIYDMIRNESPDFGYKYPGPEYEVTFERIGGMDEREVLLPAMLKAAGYRSAIYGKWDLGSLRRYLPRQRGFDDFYGFVNTGIDYFTHERYGVPSMYAGDELTQADRGTYCTDLFEREATRFVRENRDRPFLLYLPFNAPHGASNLDPRIRSAAQAPEEYKRMYPHLEDSYVDGKKYGQAAQVASPSKRRLEYLASITCMDATIGKVLDLLDEYQLTDNTLVIFFSDNGGSGGSDNSPLRGHKSQMFEGGIRVCCLMRYPGRIPAGSVCDEFLTSLEIVPTVLAATGAAAPAGVTLDGFDLLPVVSGQQSSPRTKMFWQRRDHFACRVENWKWIRIGEKESLYDLMADVSEERNLLTTQPEIARRLRESFQHWEAEMQASEPRGPFRDF
ncbi:MAG: sulfatase-like hydrolase/transferase [Planctomycetaceae bacterium]|nr:sulfatase-like hydrolase/transferase [Planctomycetaceae bacterium]